MVNLSELEKQKAETLDLLQGWAPARLKYRPMAGAWTAAEVIDHIAKVERGIIGAAQQGLLKPHGVGVRDRLGFLFLERVFRTPRRVKVPESAPQVLPEPDVSLSTAGPRWDESRQELAKLLAQTTQKQMRDGVFQHPVSGWMSVPQILRFFSAHVEHHRFQLARLAEESQPP